MRSKLEWTQKLLEYAFHMISDNVEKLTLEEALYVPEGGYRSVLGTLKHIAGWAHVYRSYAFDPQPRHWDQIDWPHGLRDKVIKTSDYVCEVIDWLGQAHHQWMEDLAGVSEEESEQLRSCHWGEQAPLCDIVLMIAGHHMYHAGEINQLLSIIRGEAWEEGEEVEENNISTLGHRVVPPWKRAET
ncbi:MAG: DinB family protein [Chloroflexota bacterium]